VNDRSTRATVLITGAGGVATPSLIQRLQRLGYRVVAADLDPQAVGLYLADAAYEVPAGGSPDFPSALVRICERESVSAVIPLVDEELEAALALEARGTIVLLPRLEFVRTCLDKLALMRALDAAGIGAPATWLASAPPETPVFPLVAKPRTGRGSKGLSILRNQSDLGMMLASNPLPPDRVLLQQYIDGPEFTVSVLAWRDGEVQAVVPKEIICKRGITRLAVTRRNAAVDAVCRAVQRELHADGPFNVQLRLDRASGKPFIFEINPRFSTTVSLTIAAGVDEVGGLLGQALGVLGTAALGEWREGVVLVRRTQDEFWTDREFAERAGKILEA